MAKTVAIIGAGPSGLVAAKTLLHSPSTTKFHVTVFEKSHRIGGLWPSSPEGEEEDKMSPDMCTNQSRHTVSFSDFCWGKGSRAFPRAWEVGGYLEGYRDFFGVDVCLGVGVESVRRVGGESGRGGEWELVVRNEKEGREELKRFDFVVVATGFFGKERIASLLKDVRMVPVKHSSKIRDVRSLITDDGKRDLGSVRERNIVVVGGQMSGVETAANIAFQLSSLTNTPGDEKEVRDWGRWTITHVVEKPVWVLPLFFPRDPEVEVEVDGEKVKKTNPSPEFSPLDLVNYNIAWRPPGPIQNTSGIISEEAAQRVHSFMNTYIGTDQTEYGAPVLGIKGEEVRKQPPILACSDYYTEFVRSGKIRVVQGRMKDVSEDGRSMQIQDVSGTTNQISDIAAIISATGFDASSSLSFLPSSLLQILLFDPTSDSFPLALNVHATVNHSLPSLGFVGFYRSPYWGVMEMQARYLLALWNNDLKATQALAEDTTLQEGLKLRNHPRRAQFPMGDYTYLMESFSSILSIPRSEADPSSSTKRTGIVLPSRYLPSNASEPQKQQALTSLSTITSIFTRSSKSTLYIPRATFHALQGTWSLSRAITSALPTFPSGTLSGTASFLPRATTVQGYDAEYLYYEEGEFRPFWGGVMSARRAYVWCYQEREDEGVGEERDKIDVWFVKGDGKSADYYFHGVRFFRDDEADERAKGKGERGWRAKNEHLCIEDLYNVEYEFFFRGTAIERWTSRYLVKGPKKDYTIENLYVRPRLGV